MSRNLGKKKKKRKKKTCGAGRTHRSLEQNWWFSFEVSCKYICDGFPLLSSVSAAGAISLFVMKSNAHSFAISNYLKIVFYY